LAALIECGVPDTLVHGDFHPGNVAGRRPDSYVILDWGDSFVGHPLIDELAFVERLSPSGGGSRLAGGFSPPGSESCRVRIPAARPSCWSPWFRSWPRSCTRTSVTTSNPDERIYHASDAVRMLRDAATPRDRL
jgi:hypothetical protein